MNLFCIFNVVYSYVTYYMHIFSSFYRASFVYMCNGLLPCIRWKVNQLYTKENALIGYKKSSMLVVGQFRPDPTTTPNSNIEALGYVHVCYIYNQHRSHRIQEEFNVGCRSISSGSDDHPKFQH
jgi:hypothetical protein